MGVPLGQGSAGESIASGLRKPCGRRIPYNRCASTIRDEHALANKKNPLIQLRNRLFPGRKLRNKAAKAAARAERFQDQTLWQQQDGFAKRAYESYEAYLAHQASKLDADYERRVEKDEADVGEFLRRFSSCGPLAAHHSVLCLGARLGGEVRALRDLGHFAVGIDLNPGKDNPYVHYGDFHALAFRDGSVDAVYINALDHAFDFKRLFTEIHRVLKPGGLFIAHMLAGFEQGFLPGKFESSHWRHTDDLLRTILDTAPFEQVGFRELGMLGRNPWFEALLVKKAA
jgi:SAM-dependent methyltransferase